MTRSRKGLLVLLWTVGLNAIGGGVYGVFLGAPEVPKQWLEGTPFHSYLIPSLILLFGVGGSSLGAALAVSRNWGCSKPLAILAGAILLGWIAVQVGLIGYVSWLQPTMAVIALLILALGSVLAPAE